MRGWDKNAGVDISTEESGQHAKRRFVGVCSCPYGCAIMSSLCDTHFALEAFTHREPRQNRQEMRPLKSFVMQTN